VSITVHIDHKLHVDVEHLPPGAFRAITEALSIPNLAKLKAQKMDEWGWQRLPDTIDLWEINAAYGNQWLVMPRGFLHDLAVGMLAFDERLDLLDHRQRHNMLRIGNKIDLKPWQIPQVEAILSHEQGIVKAPAGSGKTVAVLAAIQKLGIRSLVIINTKDILWQWQKRVADFLGPGYPIGQVGDNTFEISPYITIATAQTLHRRFDTLEADGFFDRFGFVCLDECHHATAETYNKILNRFSSRFRVGVSATPDKTGDFALATNVLGPIIHETRPDEVDILIKPKVIKVPTKFGFGFRGHRNRWQRSNYGEMIAAIISDPDRNMLITRCVMANEGHHNLLVSKRLEHLSILQDLLIDEGYRDPIVTIIGKNDREHRQEAVELAANEPCLILSTLADEAMDIPRLDRIFLPFPQKNAGLVTQQVGRVEREHPDKADALIYDFADMNVGPLEKQWRVRRFEVYEPRGYKIETLRTEVG
jgi:superfamily II DNA or RNA helicase